MRVQPVQPRTLAFAIAAATFAASSSAAADQWVGETQEAGAAATTWRAQGNRVSIDLDVMRNRATLERFTQVLTPDGYSGDALTYSADGSQIALVVTTTGQFRLGKQFLLDVEAPALAFQGNNLPGVDSWLVAGSVVAGLHWSKSIGSRAEVHVGVKASARPWGDGKTVSFSSYSYTGEISSYSYTGETGIGGAIPGARAYVDAHRAGSGGRVGGGVEVKLGSSGYYRGDAAVVAFIYGKTTTVVLETIHELEYRSASGLGGGLHVQAIRASHPTRVTLDGDSSDTFGIVAVEPFVGFEPAERGLIGRLGVLLPLGPSDFSVAKDAGIFSVRASLGAKW